MLMRSCFRFCSSWRVVGCTLSLVSLGIVVALGAKEPKDRFSPSSPSSEQIQLAKTEIQTLFKERLARADSPAQCAEVARFLLEQNESFADRPDLQFVMFDLASNLAEQSEDLALIDRTFVQWSERFDVDAGDRHARSLYRLARRWPEERAPELVAATSSLIDREIANPSESTLESVDGLLQYLAARTRLPDATVTLRQKRTLLSAERRYRADLQLAKQTLTRHPDDERAHTVVGLHLCLRDQLWTMGLSHLAKSDDPILRQAAEQDLESPSLATDRIALADQWLQLAQQDELRKGLALRAAHWYLLAKPEADARMRIQIDDRMMSIGSLLQLSSEDLVSLIVTDEGSSISDESEVLENELLEQAPVAPVIPVSDQDLPETIDPTRTWQAHGGTIWCLALSPDRTRLATAGEDRIIKIWRLNTGELESELAGSENTIFTLSFLPRENAILSGGMDDQVRKWSLDEPGSNQIIGRHDSYVRSVFLDSRGLIVSGSDDRHVALWHPVQGLVDRRQAHESIVYETALSPDGKWLVTAGQDRLVKVWNPNRPQPFVLDQHRDKVRAISFTPDSRSLVTAGEDQRILLWNLPPQGPPRELRAQDFVYDTDISPDGKWLAAVGREKQVRLWNLSDFSPGPLLTAVRDELKAVAFVSANQVVAVGKDGAVYVWDLP